MPDAVQILNDADRLTEVRSLKLVLCANGSGSGERTDVKRVTGHAADPQVVVRRVRSFAD